MRTFVLSLNPLPMTVSRTSNTFIRWFRWIGVPSVGLIVYGLSFVINPQIFGDFYYQQLGWKAYACDLLFVLMGSWLLFETGLWLSRTLDRWMPWSERPLRRLFWQFFLLVGVSVLLTVLLVRMMEHLTVPGGYQITETDKQSIRQTVVLGVILAFCVNAVYTGEYFFRRWRTSLTETERLKRESTEARFEALKSQLDPHFLFNNLNTLTYLVEDNPQAVAFVENLSLVYRYVLQNRSKPLVPLHDELKLAEAYLFLLKNRFGDGLRVEVDVPDCDRDRLIAPMTLQLLLENAVKHNVVSTDHPLTITLRCGDSGELLVQNSRHPRQSVEGRTGIGLRNIRHRYELLTHRQVQVGEEAGRFLVRVPLL